MWVPININQQVSGLNFRDPPDINYNCQQCKFVLALGIFDTFKTSCIWLKRKLIQFLSKYLFFGWKKCWKIGIFFIIVSCKFHCRAYSIKAMHRIDLKYCEDTSYEDCRHSYCHRFPNKFSLYTNIQI